MFKYQDNILVNLSRELFIEFGMIVENTYNIWSLFMKRLYRSNDNRLIAGVCGGIGEYFDIDPVIIRLLSLLLVAVGGAGVFAYIIAWVVIPSRNNYFE